MKLKIYNTLSRKKEEFKPLKKTTVGYYTCGPTVYNYAHIGNFRTYIFEDILKRTLQFNGYEVKHVMNITDVGHLTDDADEGEDKIEMGAQREGKTAQEIAKHYADEFKYNLKELNILPPDLWPKATEHIKEQIALIQKLENKGFTYKTSDGIYFDSSKFKGYEKLAKLDVKGLQEGARVQKNKEKRNSTDFALWKFSPKGKKRQMEWNSPWGIGFPGWHIECSAMSMKYLGNTIDIHAGGIDHLPVHHTNEIAQSEAATGQQFVKFWVHGDFLLMEPTSQVNLNNASLTCLKCGYKNNIKNSKEFSTKKEYGKVVYSLKCKKCGNLMSLGVKMAKSEGNFITLKTLIDKGYNPLAYRYFVLQAHYRSKLHFSWKALDAAQTALDKLYDRVAELKSSKTDKTPFEKKFQDAINDDLNTPQALAVVWDLLKSKTPEAVKKNTLIKFDQILGLGLSKITKKKVVIPENIKKLAEQREQARSSKDWPKADDLRIEIEKLGYTVEDTAQGPKLLPK